MSLIDGNEAQRAEKEKEAQEQLDEMRRRQHALAREMFEDPQSLRKAIDEKVGPRIRWMNNNEGVSGCVFLLASGWMVGAAHVLKDISRNELELNGKPVPLIDRFVRPFTHSTPDVVVLQSSLTDQSGLRDHCFLDEGTLYPGQLYCLQGADGTLHHLTLKKESPDGPLVFGFEKGLPIPGSSGSPVICARVVLGKKPTWDFTAVGVLVGHAEGSILVESLSLERRQIFSVLCEEANAQRAADLNQAAQSLGVCDATLFRQPQPLQERQAYEAGKTQKSYFRREMTPLAGSCIRALGDSLRVNREKCKKYHKQRYTVEAIRNEFNQLLDLIPQVDALTVPTGGQASQWSSFGILRIDVHPGQVVRGKVIQGNFVRFEVQDAWLNKHNKPIKENNKALSSVFAIAKVPKACCPVSGGVLREMLEQSAQSLKPVVYEGPCGVDEELYYPVVPAPTISQ